VTSDDPRAKRRRVLHALISGATILAAVNCGGGGGDGGPTGPPPAPIPARITLSQAGPLTLASGSTTTVTATVTATDGRVVTGVTVTWTSSSPNVASVAEGLITAVLVGSTTITASVGAVSSAGLVVNVTPGVPAQLGLRTQPGGAAVALPFATQPVVEVRDAAGNTVTSSVLAVSAALASGGGTLSGNTTVSAAAGVATFSGLTLVGLVGPRSLTFTAQGVSPVTSAPFTLAPGNPSQLMMRDQPVAGALGALFFTPPAVELRDVAGNVATGSNAPVTAAISFGSGTVNAVAGVATFTDLTVTGAVGDRELSFSQGALPPVVSARFHVALIVYGMATQKIQVLDPNATFAPRTSSGPVPTFLSRSPSRATVDNGGRITSRAEGQAWVTANIAGGGDSVLVIVPRSPAGPILRTSLTTFVSRAGDSTIVDLVLDPRTTAVGAVSLFVGAKSVDYSPTVRAFVSTVAGAQIAAFEPNLGIYRFSIASAAGVTAPITFGRLIIANGPPGSTLMITINAIDAYAPDGADLYGVTTSTFYPLSFR
jgi:hypothetical protein